MDLRAAHMVLNDLKARSRAQVEIHAADVAEAVGRIEAFGVTLRVRPAGADL